MKAAGMMMLLLASSCFVASPVMTFGGGKSAKQAQRDVLGKMTPPALVVDAEWQGPVTTAKIRVLADDDYRAQNVHWQQTFQDQLDYTNEILVSQFGVRLVPEYRAWSYRAGSAGLDQSLTALAREDAGQDVLSVIGLTSSLSLVSATFDKLGVAATPGRHLIVRGYADVEERTMFEQAFPDLSANERSALYVARRRHKTTTLLLHELAHNLGAAHRPEADTVMSASYSTRVSSFDAVSRETILATLDARLGRAARATPRTTTGGSPVPVPQDAHTTLVIVVDAAGKSLVGGMIVDDDTLDGLLRLSFEDDRETSIIVKATRNAPRSNVTKVVERAKASGLQRVSVVEGD